MPWENACGDRESVQRLEFLIRKQELEISQACQALTTVCGGDKAAVLIDNHVARLLGELSALDERFRMKARMRQPMILRIYEKNLVEVPPE